MYEREIVAECIGCMAGSGDTETARADLDKNVSH